MRPWGTFPRVAGADPPFPAEGMWLIDRGISRESDTRNWPTDFVLLLPSLVPESGRKFRPETSGMTWLENRRVKGTSIKSGRPQAGLQKPSCLCSGPSNEAVSFFRTVEERNGTVRFTERASRVRG